MGEQSKFLPNEAVRTDSTLLMCLLVTSSWAPGAVTSVECLNYCKSREKVLEQVSTIQSDSTCIIQQSKVCVLSLFANGQISSLPITHLIIRVLHLATHQVNKGIAYAGQIQDYVLICINLWTEGCCMLAQENREICTDPAVIATFHAQT